MVRLFCLPAMIISVTDVMAHEGDKVFTNRKRMIAYEENTVLIYIKQNSPSLSSQRRKSISRAILTIHLVIMPILKSRLYIFHLKKSNC